jgi:HNH endonuclease
MGPDEEENLMTLCVSCHRRVHRREKGRATGDPGEEDPSGLDGTSSSQKEVRDADLHYGVRFAADHPSTLPRLLSPNGKTSAIRAMLSSSGLDGHSIWLFHEKTDDFAVEKLFQAAANTAPAMIVLEDLDRAFPRVTSPGARSNARFFLRTKS